MKTQTISALVALASSVPLATATFSWTGASKFSCPANTDNKCNSQQSSGFDWTSLDLGNFGSYGGFDFSGFSCASSFGGSTKRDYITGRTFQNKCITGKATKDISSAPSFGCGSGGDVDKFSIDHFQVSVEFDCDLEFHYDMPDGSTCKQKSSCKKSGTTVKNTQCGGAKNVSVILPSGSGGGKDSCSIGFHSVGFDCNSASSTVPPTSKPTTSIPATTPASSEAVTTPSSSATSEGTESTPPASTSTAGVSILPTSTPPFPTGNDTTSAGTSPTETTPAVTTPPTLTTSTIFETRVSTIISCAETVTNCPAHSTVLTTVIVPVSTTICPVTATGIAPGTTSSAEGVTTSPVETSPAESTSAETTPATISSAEGVTSTPVSVDITTVIIQTSTTLCPVTTTHTSEGVTSVETGVSTSTVIITSTSTVCTKCTVKPTSEAPATTSSAKGVTSEVATTATTSSGPVTTAPCPDVLPQCLNTWLFSSGCSDNTDADCYCPSGDFVSSVYQCLSAYGASDDDVAKAQQYFQGICAAHIPSNPAIVTGASPVATSSSAGVTAPAFVPVTTVQVLTTIVVPCTETEGPSAGSVIPSSSSTVVISTALTVPQVVFSTITAGASASGGAALVPGTAPASVPAGATTPVAPAQTTFASVITSGVANSTKPATTSPVPFTGAGSQLSTTFGGVLVAVVFAVFAM